MNIGSIRLAALLGLAVVGASRNGFGADEVVLRFKSTGPQGEVGLHSTLGLPVSAMYPEYTVFCSTNLQTWQQVAGPISGGVGVSDEYLRVAVPLAGDQAFYRVTANVKLADAGNNVGDAIFGYGTEFSRELQRLGQLPLSDFITLYNPTNQYLPQISFDPTTAEFWGAFNLDPAVHNATNAADPRLTDFRLNTNEFAVFQTNGFVVSQRLGTFSFADAFYKIYTDDLPVFFSADAALHAWHRSYISMLEELEETYLAPQLEQMINGMRSRLDFLFWLQSRNTAVSNGVYDADYFLAVAKSLVTGTNIYGVGPVGQSTQIQNTLTAIDNRQPIWINMFGTDRLVDFSQFTVRGHYESSRVLSNYFRAVMWCGLIDFRFTGSTSDNSLRELSGAVAMNMLMSRSGQFSNWLQFDNVVQMFVGQADSLNFAQLSDLLAAANIQNPSDLPDTTALQNLQDAIMSGQLGVQDIRSGYFYSPLTREQIKLPRSFTVMGQRFILDGWAHSKCVFDDIIWDEDGIPGFEDKVMRRVPSALDVAFSVLGNSQIVPELAARIANTNLTPADGRHFWRDGRRYQHNLAAVRNVVDAQEPAAWTNNIYSSWLACLRELSAPTTDLQYPEAMRTRAWGMKTLNTQLASWTELRHDTVLYAKQPYTGIIICLYPDGFVEPRPSFWARMREMALRTRDLMTTLPNTGQFVFEPNNPNDRPFTESLATLYINRLQLLDGFADTMATLQAISEKELNHVALSTNETVFLKGLVESQYQPYTGVRTYSGWYPSLFYLNARTRQSNTMIPPSDKWDALVTDVHTDPFEPIVGDPGSILHEGVGNVFMLMIAVDCGVTNRSVYAGPVLSHYEFELGPTTRETDSQWKDDIRNHNLPPPPDWTQGHLVPGSYTLPPGL